MHGGPILPKNGLARRLRTPTTEQVTILGTRLHSSGDCNSGSAIHTAYTYTICE